MPGLLLLYAVKPELSPIPRNSSIPRFIPHPPFIRYHRPALSLAQPEMRTPIFL